MPENYGTELHYTVTDIAAFVNRAGNIDMRPGGFSFTGGRGTFSPTESGERYHRLLQAQGEGDPYSGEDYEAEVPLSVLCDCGGIPVRINGRADAVIYMQDGSLCVEEIKTIAYGLAYADPSKNPAHITQGMCYAYMLAETEQISRVTLRITYCLRGSGEKRSFEHTFLRGELKVFFSGILSYIQPFVKIDRERREKIRSELSNLRFPYGDLRGGQRDFVLDAYRAVKKGSRLLVSAPTGIGKTMAALYPTLRGLGDGHCEKIFYLTAKSVAGEAAMNAHRELGRRQPCSARCIMILSRERFCPHAEKKKSGRGFSESMCNPVECPYAAGHFDRVNGAVLDVLASGKNVIDRNVIAEAAKKHTVCPYELALDVSEWCETVVCDYNYLFDSRVRFRRYFENKGGAYAFLIDEAHNLPDRAREIFSASLDSAAFSGALAKLMRRLTKADLRGSEDITVSLSDEKAGDPGVIALVTATEKLRNLSALCEETAEEYTDAGGETYRAGYYVSRSSLRAASDLAAEFVRMAKDAGTDEYPELSELYFEAKRFAEVSEMYGKGFTTMVEAIRGEVRLSILCLDPAEMLDRAMSLGKSAVLFSATLTPLDYFSDVLGCAASGDAVTLELGSPYDRENLCIAAVDTESTRYLDRDGGYEAVASYIAAAAESKRGNYLVYFPSYRYMKQVRDVFRMLYPDIFVIAQKKFMNEDAKAEFMRAFSSKKRRSSLVGFCVLGGVFSEGIDLAGDRLIGTVIVGTGLAAPDVRLNLMREYYDETKENGYEYAFVYPGMNRVLQAAGRVIRSDTDKGVVILIDDRYGEGRYRQLFPPHWSGLRYAGNEHSLRTLLEEFWDRVEQE